MRIIAGAWRGRPVVAPPGAVTRPTAERMRQALFDALLHAPWAGRAWLDGARVLDAFAGTGALGLEALSRGAAHATFMETDSAAFAALRGNIASLGAGARSAALAVDATRPPPTGAPCDLVFLDPPYRRGLVAVAVGALAAAGWLAPTSLLIAETARNEPPPAPEATCVWERAHGAARVTAWRRQSTPPAGPA